jgi:uncharacterized ubiquitin-like protein YukD
MADLDVTVTDMAGARREDVTLPDDAEALHIIAKLVEVMDLPLNSPDGAPMSYVFHHNQTGRQINDSSTLAQAGVQNGDTLRLLAQIVAG